VNVVSMRFGFATNSSSTHSIVFGAPEGTQDHLCSPEGPDSHGWGQEYFVAVEKATKDHYFAAQFAACLARTVGDELAAAATRELFGIPGFRVQGEHRDLPYVDHESSWGIPDTIKPFEEGPDLEFARALLEFVQRDDVVVVGGNDNDGPEGPAVALLKGGRKRVPWPTDCYGKGIITRYDSGVWTLFAKNSGFKVSFTLEGADSFTVPEGWRPSAPQLVDLKVTDRCECKYGCAHYCYQASGPKGLHAKSSEAEHLVRALGDLGCLEVAIGGGEPALYPGLPSLLRTCSYANVVPNFSTRESDWLSGSKLLERVQKHCGAVAFSVSSPHNIQFIESKILAETVPRLRHSYHYVVGTGALGFLLDAVGYWRAPITLLGYKLAGRGAAQEPVDEDWLGLVTEARERYPHLRVGIDTVLAANARERLGGMGIPEFLYETREGRTSCYIDAVTWRIGPYSFCEEEQMIDLPRGVADGQLAEAIREAFQSFAAE